MSSEQQRVIAAEVFAALEAGTLELPTLPDVALKIRSMIDDPNVSAEGVVRLLSADPAISAQIIKAANSSAFSNGSPVQDLRTAISRLGYRLLHTMVITITMNQLFKSNNRIITQKLKQVWDHSSEVAAISYVLALQQRHLKPELAMLAGLVHDIGALPLCMYASRHHPELDQEHLEGLVRRFHTETGTALLEKWNFPAELVEVVVHHENLQRMPGSDLADYSDVVTVANLMKPTMVKFVAWENVSALGRLGLSANHCQNFFTSHAEQLHVAHELLGINSPKPTAPIRSTSNVSAQVPIKKPDHPQSRLSGLFKLFKLFK